MTEKKSSVVVSHQFFDRTISLRIEPKAFIRFSCDGAGLLLWKSNVSQEVYIVKTSAQWASCELRAAISLVRMVQFEMTWEYFSSQTKIWDSETSAETWV